MKRIYFFILENLVIYDQYKFIKMYQTKLNDTYIAYMNAVNKKIIEIYPKLNISTVNLYDVYKYFHKDPYKLL